MDVLLWICASIAVIVGVPSGYQIVQCLMERSVVPSRYEWLSLLDRSSWKEVTAIRLEMQAEKRTGHTLWCVYDDLSILESEQLVQFRIRAAATREACELIPEYRLTTNGVRRKSKAEPWNFLALEPV